jgi:hypothetical protein
MIIGCAGLGYVAVPPEPGAGDLIASPSRNICNGAPRGGPFFLRGDRGLGVRVPRTPHAVAEFPQGVVPRAPVTPSATIGANHSRPWLGLAL